jgi:hypothetical protein
MTKYWKPVLLLATIGVMVIGMLGSGAWFTDAATSNPTVITAGTLSIDDAKLSSVTLPPITNMAPGELTDPIKIVIENNGNIDLAWFGNLIISEDPSNPYPLKNVIYIADAEMKFLHPAPSTSTWEPNDHFITNGVGSGAWPTVWSGPDNLATLAVFDGNPGMAPGSGYEFMGALKPGYRYELTLQFGFWSGADNNYQGKGPLNITFHADATQIQPAALDVFHPSLHGMETWLNQQIAKQP